MKIIVHQMLSINLLPELSFLVLSLLKFTIVLRQKFYEEPSKLVAD